MPHLLKRSQHFFVFSLMLTYEKQKGAKVSKIFLWQQVFWRPENLQEFTYVTVCKRSYTPATEYQASVLTIKKTDAKGIGF